MVIFIKSWWIVNESSITLNLSINSNSVLLVLRLFEIFLLSSSNIFIAGSFESSLSLGGFENCFQRLSFLFIWIFWILKNNFFHGLCWSSVSSDNWSSIGSDGWSSWSSWSCWSWICLVKSKLFSLSTISELSLNWNLSSGFSDGVFVVGLFSSLFVEIVDLFNVISFCFLLCLNILFSMFDSFIESFSVTVWSDSFDFFWFLLSKRLLMMVMMVLNSLDLVKRYHSH